MQQYKKIIEELKRFSEKNENYLIEGIEELSEEIRDEKFKIAIVGEFSAGKSTFINAVLGKRILFSDNNEATKVVTEIISSSEKKGIILYKDGREEFIDLCDIKAYENLKNYFLNNKDEEIKKITIRYPSILNGNVIFLDTPGLQGMDESVVELTRKGIREAKMILYITNVKGFQGTELEILNDEIKTENLVFIVNKIGEIYEGRKKEDADNKIERLVESIRKTIISKNIKKLDLFKVDSRDYLWSKDNDLYRDVSNQDEKKILSQREYEERSNFKSIVNYFKEKLNDEQCKKIKERNLKERIEEVVDELKKYIQADDVTTRGIDELKSIENQKKIILENRKAINNKIKRNIRETYMIIKDDCVTSFENKLKEIDKKLQLKIDENIVQKNIIQENINNKTSEISKWLKGNIEEKIVEVVCTYKEHAEYLTKNINETFDDVKKVNLKFESNVSLDFRIENELIEIELNEQENGGRDELKDEIKELDENIDELKKEKEKLLKCRQKDEWNFELDKINKKIKRIEKELEREIEKFNVNKPELEVINKTIIRRRFLFFEKREIVFDRWDYSKIENWERNKEKKRNEYLKKIDDSKKEKRNIEDEILKQKEIEDKIQRCELDLKELKMDKENLEEEHRKEQRENRERFIDGKKDEIFNILSKRKRKYFCEFEEKFTKALEKEENKYKKKVEQSTEIYLKKIKEVIEEKERKFKKSLEEKNGEYKNKIKDLEKIEELIKNI